MTSKLGIGWKLGLATILLVMVGLGHGRQYIKYLDGRGIYSTLLGPNASATVEIVTFIVLPLVFVIVAFWYALRDLK